MNNTTHNKKTLAFFQETAGKKKGFYDADRQLAAHVQTWVRETAVTMLAPQRPASILDAGCGCGDFSHELAERFPEATVCGLDFSPEMLALARQQFADERLTFRESALSAMQCEDQSFDALVCINTLHHLVPVDFSRAVSECCRVARKRVLFEIKNALSPYHGIKKLKMRHTYGLSIYGTHYWALQGLLRNSGFQLTQCASWLRAGRLISPILCLMAERKEQ